MVDKVLFSSESDEWSTPQDFYDILDSEFKFTLDPCASDENHKCDKYFTISDDGLSQDWGKERVFVNPPYSKLKEWCKKSMDASDHGATVVMLVPARTDTRYFHDYCSNASEIRFIKGRLKFGNSSNSAPFPSCVIIFRPFNQFDVGLNIFVKFWDWRM